MDTDKTLWIVWGRQVRPGSLALAFTTGMLGINALTGATVLAGWWETVAGAVAVATTAILTVGWWRQCIRCATAGYASGVWTWTVVAATALTTPGVRPWGMSVMSAVGWVLLAAGLWLRDRRETP